jgi:hypothetical protein
MGITGARGGRLSTNLGASTSWTPQGLSRPVMGLLYLLHGYYDLTEIRNNNNNNNNNNIHLYMTVV